MYYARVMQMQSGATACGTAEERNVMCHANANTTVGVPFVLGTTCSWHQTHVDAGGYSSWKVMLVLSTIATL